MTPIFLGSIFETGAQYEKLGNANSGVVWFKNPRLYNTKFGIDVQFWKTARTRIKYFQDQKDPVFKTGFLHRRDKIFLGLNREFSPIRTLKFFYEYNNDTFSDDFISDEVKVVLNNFGGLPGETEFHFLGTGFDWGVINIDTYKLDGSLLSLNLRYGVSPRNQSLNFLGGFSELSISLKQF